MVPFNLFKMYNFLPLVGANVICCESIMTPLYPHLPTQTLPEITYWAPVPKENIVTSENLKKYIIHIRWVVLYL